MKKKIWRKGICAGLVLTMTVGLSACGGDGSDGGKIGGNKGGSADSSLAKQCVYAYQDLELPDMGGDNFGIGSMAQIGDKLYMIAEVYHWGEGDSYNEVKLLSANLDGSDVQTIELQKPEGEGGEKGSGEELEIGGGPIAIPSTRTEEVPISNYEYTGYSNYVLSNSDRLYAIRTHTVEDYSDPENYVSESEYTACAWDLTGTLLWETPIEDMKSGEEQFWIRNMFPAEDGSAVIWISGDVDVFKIPVDLEGNLGERQKLVNGSEVMTKANETIVNSKDGSLMVTYYNDDWTKLYLTSYDITTDTVGEEVELPASFMTLGYSNMAVGSNTDIVYSSDSGLFGWSKGDAEPVQIMNFINSDLNSSTLGNIVMLDDTHFVAFYYDNMDASQKVALFTKRNPEDIPDKRVLVAAGNYLGFDLKKRVVEFNRQSEEYRIIVKEYETYNTPEDWTAGYTQMNNDIISGNMPDILAVSAYLPMESYISKGLIADIGKLIEQDEELSQTEFMENVFNAYKVDGKLYYVIPSFSVQTLMGKTSILGDRTSWTMQEFQEFADSLPEDCQAIDGLTRDRFVYLMLQYCGNEFVDISTGKCNFDSETFIAMLEFAKTLPKEISEDYYGEDYWTTYQSQYREDRTALMEVYMNSMSDMTRNVNGYFADDVTYIGFPSENGQSSIISANENYAISAKSANLDGAWKFLRYYLTEEYQDTLQWTFPISKKEFMEKAEEGLHKPYYMDENGEKAEYDIYFDINGESIPLDPLNQEQLDQLVNVVTSVEKKAYYNRDIENIVTEETAAFFEGQKSAKDVAQIIQSRAQIFVDEHR